MKSPLAEDRPETAVIGVSRSMMAVIILGSMVIGGLIAGLRDAGPQPIASGELRSKLTLWNKPLGSSSNEGNVVQPGSRVSVFERHIVVTGADGGRTVIPIDHVGPIQLKP